VVCSCDAHLTSAGPEPAEEAFADHAWHRAAAWINRPNIELLSLYPEGDVAQKIRAVFSGENCPLRRAAGVSLLTWCVRPSQRIAWQCAAPVAGATPMPERCCGHPAGVPVSPSPQGKRFLKT